MTNRALETILSTRDPAAPFAFYLSLECTKRKPLILRLSCAASRIESAKESSIVQIGPVPTFRGSRIDRLDPGPCGRGYAKRRREKRSTRGSNVFRLTVEEHGSTWFAHVFAMLFEDFGFAKQTYPALTSQPDTSRFISTLLQGAFRCEL